MECIVFTMNICLGERIRIRHHKNTTFYLKKKANNTIPKQRLYVYFELQYDS